MLQPAEIGTARKRPSEIGEYLSSRTDSPEILDPIDCRLFKTGVEHGSIFIWEGDGKRS
jgi:uncharacterized protein (DUF736 family)